MIEERKQIPKKYMIEIISMTMTAMIYASGVNLSRSHPRFWILIYPTTVLFSFLSPPIFKVTSNDIITKMEQKNKQKRKEVSR